MSRSPHRPRADRTPADQLAALRRWLAAEAADEAGAGAGVTAARAAEASAADAALGALFAALPRPAPAPGLADRVLATARPPRAARASWGRAVARRLARRPAGAREQLISRLAAALLVLAGLAVTSLAGVVGPLADRLTPASAIRSAVDAPFGLAAALGRWAGAALDLLETLFRLAGAVATAATTGPVAGSLTALLLLAALSFAVLHRVFESDRSLSHASHAQVH